MIKKRVSWLVVYLVVGLGMVGSGRAAPVLEIDPARNVFSLTGSDTGNAIETPVPFQPSVTFDVAWDNGGATGGGIGFFQLGDPNTGDTVDSQFSAESLTIDAAGQILIEFAQFELDFEDSISSPTTITGLGVEIDYSGMSPARIAVFEGAIGSSLPVSIGSGWSSISVVAVPEPSALVLAGLAGLVGVGFALVGRRVGRVRTAQSVDFLRVRQSGDSEPMNGLTPSTLIF